MLEIGDGVAGVDRPGEPRDPWLKDDRKPSRGRHLRLKSIVGTIAGIGMVLVVSVVLLRHRAQIGEFIEDVKKLSAGDALPTDVDQPARETTKRDKLLSRRPAPAKDGESSSPSIAGLGDRATTPLKQAEPLKLEVLETGNQRRLIEVRAGPVVKLKDWTITARAEVRKDESTMPAAAPPSSALTRGSSSPERSSSQQISGGLPQQRELPEYPPLALQNNVQGTVVLKLVVGKDGMVQNVQLLSGPPMLTSAVMDAVQKWRYEPSYRNGEPVTIEKQITIDFTISAK